MYDEPTAKTSAVYRPERHLTDEDAKLICLLKRDYLWTVAELSSHMDVTDDAVRRILRGERHADATRHLRPKPGTKITLPRYPRVTK